MTNMIHPDPSHSSPAPLEGLIAELRHFERGADRDLSRVLTHAAETLATLSAEVTRLRAEKNTADFIAQGERQAHARAISTRERLTAPCRACAGGGGGEARMGGPMWTCEQCQGSGREPLYAAEVSRLTGELEQAQRSVTRSHELLTQASAYIDPEKHPAIDAAIEAELAPCDQAHERGYQQGKDEAQAEIARLTAALETLADAIVRAVPQFAILYALAVAADGSMNIEAIAAHAINARELAGDHASHRMEIERLTAALEKAEGKGIAWDAIAERLDEAHEYGSRYRVRMGSLIWHAILDDAIRLRTEREALIEVLRRLTNEASGFLLMASPEAHGQTNLNVMDRRIDEAKALLDRLTENGR